MPSPISSANPHPPMRFEQKARGYHAHASPQRRFAEALAAFAPFEPGERVTEVGAGTGFLTRALLAQGAIVDASDSSPAMVEVGREATLTFDSLPGVRRAGKVVFLAAFGVSDTKDKDVRVFPCQVAFEAGEGVRPGISANARVRLASAKGAVAVPVSAVFVDDAERYAYVRGADGAWERRAIDIGLSDSGWTEVTKGIAEGDVVSLVRPAGLR